jgi:hypothetical protein
MILPRNKKPKIDIPMLINHEAIIAQKCGKIIYSQL